MAQLGLTGEQILAAGTAIDSLVGAGPFVTNLARRIRRVRDAIFEVYDPLLELLSPLLVEHGMGPRLQELAGDELTQVHSLEIEPIPWADIEASAEAVKRLNLPEPAISPRAIDLLVDLGVITEEG